MDAIQKELENLSGFRDTSPLRRFRRQLQGESSFLKSQIGILVKNKEEREFEKQQTLDTANRNRSSKNKRVWNYVKAIQRNYRPDLSLKEIRSQLKRHRQGLETDIPDVAWRNASP